MKISANNTRKKARNSKERDEAEKEIKIDIFFYSASEILFLIIMIVINVTFCNDYKDYNKAYDGNLKFYQTAELKEGIPSTWEENREEVYHQALERFKDNPDDFNLETACKEHENDDKKPAACGGENINTPLKTTINGEDTIVVIVPDVYKDDTKDDKLSAKFIYIFRQ